MSSRTDSRSSKATLAGSREESWESFFWNLVVGFGGCGGERFGVNLEVRSGIIAGASEWLQSSSGFSSREPINCRPQQKIKTAGRILPANRDAREQTGSWSPPDRSDGLVGKSIKVR